MRDGDGRFYLLSLSGGYVSVPRGMSEEAARRVKESVMKGAREYEEAMKRMRDVIGRVYPPPPSSGAEG